MDSDFKPVRRRVKVDTAPHHDLVALSSPQTNIFLTPEQITTLDNERRPSEQHNQPHPLTTAASTANRRRWPSQLVLNWPPHKKEYLTALLIVILCASGGAAMLLHNTSKPVAAITNTPVRAALKAKPVITSNLTGLPVSAAGVNQQPVTGVMVENSVQARPQSGLSQAGVVFEAIAEGGITRFLALFQDTSPDNVGPIRSARPYYAQWALGFDAGYAHVGGSPEALADIKAWGVRDLDQFSNSSAYHRVSSRQAPHNVYTAISILSQLQATKGFTKSIYTGFVRKAEMPNKTPSVKSINLKLSGPIYNVHYDYNAATNSYLRSEGGAPHIDANNSVQISPKVVIALVMPYALEVDGYHSSYNTLGNGVAYVFQDGTLTAGTWSKPDMKSQFSFTTASGNRLKLNPGQTWLTAVGSTNNVSYAP